MNPILITQYSDQGLTHSYITRGQRLYHIGESRDPIISGLRIIDDDLQESIVRKSLENIMRDQDMSLALDDILPDDLHEEYIAPATTMENLRLSRSILDGDHVMNLEEYYSRIH